jgi:hypothetical protein
MAQSKKDDKPTKDVITYRFICKAKQVLGGATLGNYYQGQIVTLMNTPRNALKLNFLRNSASFDMVSFTKPAHEVQAEPDKLSGDPDQLGAVDQLQIPNDMVELLKEHGYAKIGQLIGYSVEELAELPDMDPDGAKFLWDALIEFKKDAAGGE